MNRFFRAVALVFGACLVAGCSSDPLAGIYRGPLSEAVKIDRDRQVLWQPPKKLTTNSDHFRFLGVLSASASSGSPQLVLPSSSPYLGTTLTVSGDGRTIIIDWKTRTGSGTTVSRSVHYTKEWC